MHRKIGFNKIIFISWTNFSRHSDLLAQASGAEIFYIDNLIHSRRVLWHLFFWLDYLSKCIRTSLVLWNTKPKFVFVQNPPSIASLPIIFFRKIYHYKVIIDSHNGAFEKKWSEIPFHKWALRQADLVTIHNSQLYNRLSNDFNFRGVKFMILNSKLTDFSRTKKETQKQPYFLVVSTFSPDEPIETLLEGIREFCKRSNSKLKFRLTGNYKKKYFLFSEFSAIDNIEFLGYIDEELYNYQLVNSFGIISLSTRDDVQQFAISEAVGAEIPFISNNNATNRDLFDNKMVLTELTPSAISSSIDNFIKNREELITNIKEIKETLANKWNSDFINIKNELGI